MARSSERTQQKSVRATPAGTRLSRGPKAIYCKGFGQQGVTSQHLGCISSVQCKVLQPLFFLPPSFMLSKAKIADLWQMSELWCTWWSSVQVQQESAPCPGEHHHRHSFISACAGQQHQPFGLLQAWVPPGCSSGSQPQRTPFFALSARFSMLFSHLGMPIWRSFPKAAPLQNDFLFQEKIPWYALHWKTMKFKA